MKNRLLFKLKQHLAQYRLVEWYRRRRPLTGRIFEPSMLDGAEPVIMHWPADIAKPRIGLVKDCGKMLYTPYYAYWPRYERFLKNNHLPYNLYDIRRSDWIEEAARFDVIIWRPESDPASQYEAENKIYLLEKTGKRCLPSYHDLWAYEDKVRQYYLYRQLDIPAIPTFVSHDRDEAFTYAANARYPIVSKLATGSGSMGVELLRSRCAAERFIRRVFAPGNPTYWTYLRQKDYVYFQEYLEDAAYDLRVIVIGDRLFGYYRMRPEDDFRASGGGRYVKKDIPEKALRIALETARKLNAPMMAVDMLHSEKRDRFFVNETSICFQIDTPEQLKVGDAPGYYELTSDGAFAFRPGRYWVQDFALEQFFRSYLATTR